MFEKDKAPLSNEILSLFEETRVSYLSAKSDPKEYSSRWRETLDKIKESYDSLSPLGKELKEYLDERHVESDDAGSPTSGSAKIIYESIKQMRFDSENVTDPFSKKLKGNVLETLLTNVDTFIKFIHYAIRSGDDALPSKLYNKLEYQEDAITDGLEGLDLSLDDVPLFIIEHYGDDKDSKKVLSKFKSALAELKKVFLEGHEEEDWNKLVGVELKKAEQPQEEKAQGNFIVPNKPMYRIFDIEDMNELKGFSGDYVVQEKYDGMRIQIHKIDNKVQIFSFNKKDITEKCTEQVAEMQKKSYGDCILDAELILFDGDKALHRADTISHVFKGNYPDAKLRVHVFDIMRHEEKNLMDDELEIRINILFNNYSSKSSDAIAFPSKKDTRIADSLKDIEEYAKEIMEMPTAEGVVIKDLTSTYFVGTKKNPKWIKWKKFVDLDLLVLDKKTTKSGLFSYSLGAGPALEEGKHIVERDGKLYMNVGKSLNTKIDVNVGKILRVKVDEVKESDGRFTLFSAKVIEVPEEATPDKLVTLELLSKSTKPSLKYKVEALTKGITISDNIHGTATIIAKSMDGFTIYDFAEDNLMSKNASVNLDMWKKQAEESLVKAKGILRSAIKQFIKQKGKPQTVTDVHNFLMAYHSGIYESSLNSNQSELGPWIKASNSMTVSGGVVSVDLTEIQKETEPTAQFKVYSRKDGNLDFIVNYKGENLSWYIDLDSDDDIFSLFGKATKFPAEISTNISKEKLIDSGDVEIGVQRHGYHEYILNGNKFETKLHFRVVPVKGEEMWLAWTGYEQKPVDKDTDEGIWNIYEDKYKDLKYKNKQ
tara:strand:+ start:14634 stop:17102 length:2469 start_codon:yes stop_codon:yes gene_type:complete